MRLGMPYVEFDVPSGSLEGIVRFYREILEGAAGIAEDKKGRHARAVVGDGNVLIFREADVQAAGVRRPPHPDQPGGFLRPA